MIEKYLKLFGLNPDAALSDVKKAYRMLAKKNHPDRFTDDEQKKDQELIMIRINEAYKKIIEYFKSKKTEPISDQKQESDYELYKKGIGYFNKCYEGILVKMEKHDLKEKENSLIKAGSYFSKVLEEYPESDWAFDSEIKLRKIEKMLSNLRDLNSNFETQPLPRKDQDFYAHKFKKMFEK